MDERGGKKKKKGRWITVLLLLMLLGGVSTLAYMAVSERGRDSGDTSDAIETSPSGTSAPVPTPMPDPPEPSVNAAPTPVPRTVVQEILDLRALYGNDDIVGYLKIEGTTIDYPVVQAGDNQFYLEHDINKQPDIAGWIFMDWQNSVEREDSNTIVYGHNMKKDYMFHAIRYFTEEKFFREHPVVIFDTLYQRGLWEVFTFFSTDTDLNYIEVFYKDSDRYRELLGVVKGLSVYDTGVDVSGEDRVLFLSTCVGANDLRYVLGARLVRD